MKAIKNLIAILIAVLAFATVGLAFSPPITAVQAQDEQSDLWVIPQNPAPRPAIDDKEKRIGDFAWRDFVALNWPSDCQGKPLLDMKIGEAPDAPRVWEFYRTPDEIFFPNGKDPTAIQPLKPLTCSGGKPGTNAPQITESGAPSIDEFIKAETARDASDSVLNSKGELNVSLKEIFALNSAPLVDQQGNYVINEIYVNPVEFNQIVKQKWYDALNLGESEGQFQLVCSKNKVPKDPFTDAICLDDEQAGAIEVKAAWRVFSKPPSDAEKARYYIARRKLLIPAQTDECKAGNAVCSATGKAFTQEVDIGLIGLHIVHKTSQQGWVWSTFEQVDNVPDSNPVPMQQYTLRNPDCAGQHCDINKLFAQTPYLWQENAPHAVTRDEEGKIAPQISSQIVREGRERESSKELNKLWQDKLKNSIWKNYKLIGTQWLGNPETPYQEAIRDLEPRLPLANVALEPYSQSMSCIVCHTGASLPNSAHADFSFLMREAQPSNSSTAQTR